MNRPSFLCFARKIALASYAPGGLGPLQVGPGPNGLSFLRGLSRLNPRKMVPAQNLHTNFFLLVKNGTFIRVEKTGFDRRSVLSELPRYVRNIEGYHKAKGRMYFRGTDGNSTFSTETGERIELSQALTSAEVSSPDWHISVVQLVDGVGRDSLSPSSKGNFTGKLLQYQIYSSLLSCRTLFSTTMLDHIF